MSWFTSRKGQNIAEYSLLIILVLAGVLVMGPYVTRSWNGIMKGHTDAVKDSYRDPLDPAPPGAIIVDCECTPAADQLPRGCFQAPCCGQAGCQENEAALVQLCTPSGCAPAAVNCTPDPNCCTTPVEEPFPGSCGYELGWPRCPDLDGDGTRDCCVPPGGSCPDGSCIRHGNCCPGGQALATYRCGAGPIEYRCIDSTNCEYHCTAGGVPTPISQTTWNDSLLFRGICPLDDVGLRANTEYTIVPFNACSKPEGSHPKCQIQCERGLVYGAATNGQPGRSIWSWLQHGFCNGCKCFVYPNSDTGSCANMVRVSKKADLNECLRNSRIYIEQTMGLQVLNQVAHGVNPALFSCPTQTAYLIENIIEEPVDPSDATCKCPDISETLNVEVLLIDDKGDNEYCRFTFSSTSCNGGPLDTPHINETSSDRCINGFGGGQGMESIIQSSCPNCSFANWDWTDYRNVHDNLPNSNIWPTDHGSVHGPPALGSADIFCGGTGTSTCGGAGWDFCETISGGTLLGTEWGYPFGLPGLTNDCADFCNTFTNTTSCVLYSPYQIPGVPEGIFDGWCEAYSGGVRVPAFCLHQPIYISNCTSGTSGGCAGNTLPPTNPSISGLGCAACPFGTIRRCRGNDPALGCDTWCAPDPNWLNSFTWNTDVGAGWECGNDIGQDFPGCVDVPRSENNRYPYCEGGFMIAGGSRSWAMRNIACEGCGQAFVGSCPDGVCSGSEQCGPDNFDPNCMADCGTCDTCDEDNLVDPPLTPGNCEPGEDNSNCIDCFCGDQALRDPPEECDPPFMGLRPNCDDHGFHSDPVDCFPPGSANECTYDTSNCRECGDGVVNDPTEECDGADLGAQPDCPDHGSYQPGPVGCTACSYDTSVCVPIPVCGDNTINQAFEECDGADLGSSPDCSDHGFAPGPVGCHPAGSASECTYDTSSCSAAPSCGDNLVNQAFEDCDGSDMGAQPDCTDHGFSSGTLDCFAPGTAGECTYDTSGCVAAPSCGDNLVNQAFEECDGSDMGAQPDCTDHGFSSGTLDCFAPGTASECTYDTSGCAGGSGVWTGGLVSSEDSCFFCSRPQCSGILGQPCSPTGTPYPGGSCINPCPDCASCPGTIATCLVTFGITCQ